MSSLRHGSGHIMPADPGYATTLFAVAAGVRLICALYSIIPDCDEVFNYWEPTHYITHGFGLETWEYSPKYAIRSWAYVWIHAYIITICRRLGVPEIYLFFALRAVLGTFCAYCEAQFSLTLRRSISPVAGLLFLTFSLSSAGMFHASVTFLPSSFSMYMTMLAFSNMLDPVPNSLRGKTVSTLVPFAISGILGWPFALAVGIPYVLSLVTGIVFGPGRIIYVTGIINAIFVAAAVLAAVVSMDTWIFKRLQIVPLNIVLYNVLESTAESGPDIFGTEPLTYYIKNLALNFGIVAVLAVISPVAVVVRYLINGSARLRLHVAYLLISSLAVWIAVFFPQPHKEERFFYVVYPIICACAALSVDSILHVYKATAHSIKVPVKLVNHGSFFLKISLIVVSLSYGIFRMFAYHALYFAPLEVYGTLSIVNADIAPNDVPINVCVGREWYRFPSSYFLPSNMRLKLIKSNFDGMLPAEFEDDVPWYIGASQINEGLNNLNQEEMSFYIPLDQCDYLVDSNFTTPVGPESFEAQYVADTDNWDIVTCKPFIDSENSTLLARIFKFPDSIEKMIPPVAAKYFRRSYTSYCLLRNKQFASD
ncbi:Alg9-like mannosyltransferase family-domain-containing protein [Limtongia smithiae]|uniref:Alg9-like mannosyltransferase family-domain-containing protein n=1 Tax=Limtongia smithiae TaxID=1125753 RepID=UPI0034CE7A4F